MANNTNYSCVYTDIQDVSDKCWFAKEHCMDDVPLAKFYYCSFIDSSILWSVIAWLLFSHLWSVV